ncbi:unnamed protein product [Dicrocoelium dendriticum]|nr:unnamed protein product [Dicrocoelium dendriticum]
MCSKCGNTTRLICMLALVAIYFFVELIVGYVVNSVALVADAFHMLSDFMALVVGIVAARIAKWPSSSKNTFGWQRAEVMGGLINTVMLITLCCTILLQAIQRFITTEPIENPRLMIYVGAGGLLVNILGMLVLGVHSHGGAKGPISVTEEEVSEFATMEAPLKPDAKANLYKQHLNLDDHLVLDSRVGSLHTEEQRVLPLNASTVTPTTAVEPGRSKQGKHTGSVNMRAVFLHVLADFFGSIIVVVSALLLAFAPGDVKTDGVWKLYVDPSMSVLMVVIILASAVPLMCKAALILLQSVPNEISLKNLKARLEMIDGIHEVHDLHVWRLQSNCIIGTVHIRCRSLPDYLKIAHKVKELFHDFDIHCSTIQPEFEEYSEEKEPDEIDYGKCVLDCGPNKNCQSDTCCPAPVSASSVTGPAGAMQPVVVNKFTAAEPAIVKSLVSPNSTPGNGLLNNLHPSYPTNSRISNEARIPVTFDSGRSTADV